MSLKQAALELHRLKHGKITVTPKVQVTDDYSLALAYTPGVAEPCKAISADPEQVYEFTSKRNMVAVVSDGSRVLGLGDIGPHAAIPVMEGKAVLFREFGGVDAFPICLDTRNPEEFIQAVKWISPMFGGINLEDIATPKCYLIEERLRQELDIPVFHDDQHGTAVVAAASVINALKLVGRELGQAHVVINGAGAAGTAIARLFLPMGTGRVTLCDRAGILYPGMPGLNGMQEMVAGMTNPWGMQGDLLRAAEGADVLIGVSAAGAFTPDILKRMGPEGIVFSLSNPDPEISYQDALACGVRVAGTGRSDAPNQVNNVLAFPGIFRGALDVRASDINEEMKVAAALAIAAVIPADQLTAEYVVPKPFDPRVAPAVAAAVAKAAIRTGVARQTTVSSGS